MDPVCVIACVYPLLWDADFYCIYTFLVNYLPNGFLCPSKFFSFYGLWTLKLLHLEYFVKICCSATFSLPTRWCVLCSCIALYE